MSEDLGQVVHVPTNVALVFQAAHCLYRSCAAGCPLVICFAGYGDSDQGERTTLANCMRCVTQGPRNR